MIFETFESPFCTNGPVDPEMFKGRHENVRDVLKYIPTVINQGKLYHFFITGKRGMGKTSFVKYLSKEVEDTYQMIPIYINNDGNNTIESLVSGIMGQIINEVKKENLGDKVLSFISTNFDEIKLGSAKFKFNHDIVENTRDNFSNFLINVCDELYDNKKGLFIVIDDMNGLSEDPNFTSWYKSFTETIDFARCHTPIVFLFVSYLETFDKLTDINPSFSRIFKLIKIDEFYSEDMEDFFIDSFENYGVKFRDDGSLDQMVYFAWGMPLAMQQIGESVYWNLEHEYIDLNTVNKGIINAGYEIGDKQIRTKLNKIKSNHYENILIKLGEHECIHFKRSNAIKFLNNSEKKVFDDFLKRMKDLNIINSIGKENSGEYEFSNRLYFVYFLIIGKMKKILIQALNDGKISKREFDKYYVGI